ncbi:MAG: glycosyltransferase family 4 protein [Steroidobacteraceae bacterium]
MTTLLSINNYYYYRGGAETVFLEQNAMFRQCGWNVVPFAMQSNKNLSSPWSKYFVDEIEFGQSYSLADKLTRVPKVIYSFEARRKLARVIDESRPDVCHAHNIYHHISPSILSLLKQRSIPVVLTLHDLKIACPAYSMLTEDGVCERCRGGRLHNVVLHRCIKRSVSLSAIVMLEATLHRLLGTYSNHVGRFAVPSRFYIEKLCDWGWPRSMFCHVPNFVDARRYQPQYEAGKYFLYFGRLSREKGLATLIRAAASSGCRILLAGTGPQLAELGALTTKLGADVTFLGFLTGESLHAAVRGARAVVLPSEWYENAPMTVLEAYALGKPVLGARIGGIPELVYEDETGLGFTSGDAESLAAALRHFAERSDKTIEDMGRQARQRVEQQYTAELYRQRLMSIYRDLGVPLGGT